MSFNSIPTVDMADFLSGDADRKAKFVEELGHSFSNIGFAIVSNHGVSPDLRDNLYASVKDYFALPDEVKLGHHDPAIGGQRGYTPKGQEHAKGRSTGDLKEFYHFGQEVEDGDAIKAEYPDNIWPAEVPAFSKNAREVYTTFEETGKHLLRATAIFLGLEETYFDAKIHNGNSILRPIHYYPIENPEEIADDAVRAAEHEDINLITLLMGASADGLQVKNSEGAWVAASPNVDQIVINVGDMLQRLTNNKLRSTTHRVVNPPREKMHLPRYSIPFFLHPRSDMDLTCLDSCIDGEHPKQYDDVTAGEYLHERLVEIGLIKK